jgi:uncharacterized membrane protein
MAQDRTRKIVVTGALSAVIVLLGLTRWGFIPWVTGFSLTIMQVPVIIGAILEGPLVGLGIGLIFGIFSLISASSSATETIFLNPLVSILPRLFIGPASWLVWKALKKFPTVGMAVAGFAGSLTNTVLVLGMLGILKVYPWLLLGSSAVFNGLPEAVLSSIITVIVVSLTLRIKIGGKKGSDL